MMRLLRLARIVTVALRFGLDEFLLAHARLGGLRVLVAATLFWRRLDRPRGERLRLALENLGPIFVKFGQVLSTRRDLLPLDIADELAKLQDRVPPFASELAVAEIERSLGKRIDELFASFERTPVASASIAQVHLATLKDGREVAVKVLRPGVERSALLCVPEVYWDLCSQGVMVMERMRGTPSSQVQLLREKGINIPALAR